MVVVSVLTSILCSRHPLMGGVRIERSRVTDFTTESTSFPEGCVVQVRKQRVTRRADAQPLANCLPYVRAKRSTTNADSQCNPGSRSGGRGSEY